MIKWFSSKATQSRHRNITGCADPPISQFHCCECDKDFNTQNALTYHLKNNITPSSGGRCSRLIHRLLRRMQKKKKTFNTEGAPTASRIKHPSAHHDLSRWKRMQQEVLHAIRDARSPRKWSMRFKAHTSHD